MSARIYIAACFVLEMTLTGCLLPGGSGGCTNHDIPTNPRSAPETPCLTVTVTNVSGCVGDYDIEIANSCTTSFDVEGQTIAPGSKGVISATPLSPFCSAGACSVTGDLGGSSVLIEWTLERV